jgi:hypothetical protein
MPQAPMAAWQAERIVIHVQSLLTYIEIRKAQEARNPPFSW